MPLTYLGSGRTHAFPILACCLLLVLWCSLRSLLTPLPHAPRTCSSMRARAPPEEEEEEGRTRHTETCLCRVCVSCDCVREKCVRRRNRKTSDTTHLSSSSIPFKLRSTHTCFVCLKYWGLAVRARASRERELARAENTRTNGREAQRRFLNDDFELCCLAFQRKRCGLCVVAKEQVTFVGKLILPPCRAPRQDDEKSSSATCSVRCEASGRAVHHLQRD